MCWPVAKQKKKKKKKQKQQSCADLNTSDSLTETERNLCGQVAGAHRRLLLTQSIPQTLIKKVHRGRE